MGRRKEWREGESKGGIEGGRREGTEGRMGDGREGGGRWAGRHARI